MTSRRTFIRDSAFLGAASFLGQAFTAVSEGRVKPGAMMPSKQQRNPSQVVRDEAYWSAIAAQYSVVDGIVNMEAGYFGMMSNPVLESFNQNVSLVNRSSSWFARKEYPSLARESLSRVAGFIGAKVSEIAFSRNATEALQAIIGQYNGVSVGDTVMYADLDYNAMQWAMNGLAQKARANVVVLNIPEPATRMGIINMYEEAFDKNPRTRLLLLTHCNNKTGLIHPVKEIAAIARSKGIHVVVDAAHSFGQLPITVSDLDADFLGLNLHKWVGAPVGVAVMYIREDMMALIDRAHADEGAPSSSINSRLHTGTTSFATVMTVPDALDFQDSIGIKNKSDRLRYLRDRWVGQVRGIDGVDILTPDDDDMVCAITSFRLFGRGDSASNSRTVRTLEEEFGIFTVVRNGLAAGDCIRITPALYNSIEHSDRLAEAVRAIALRG